MADRPEVNRIECLQLLQHRIRQGLAGTKVPLATQVEMLVVQLEPATLRGGIQDLNALSNHFRTGAVTRNHCDVV